MATTITINGNFVLDETPGLQDNDVAVGMLPAAFANRLFTDLGLSNAFATSVGVGKSADNFITVASDTPVTGLSWVDSGGGALNGDPTGLFTLDGNEIYLYTDSVNPNIVLGREGSGGMADPNGSIVFALFLEPTNASNTAARVWSITFEALADNDAANNPDNRIDLGNSLGIAAAALQTFNFDGAPAGNVLFMAFGTTASAILVNGEDPANQSEGENVSSGDTVNTSKQSTTTLGTNAQQIAAGDAIFFTYVTGMNSDFLVPNLTSTEAGIEANIQFTGFNPANSAEFKVVKVSGGSGPVTVSIAAFNTALETGNAYVDGLHDDTPVAITDVKVNGVSVSFTTVGDTVLVANVFENDVVTFTTSGTHNRVLIGNGGTGMNVKTFSIGGFGLANTTTTSVPVGPAIDFDDDGPNPTLTLKAGAMLVVDESVGADASDGGAPPNDEAASMDATDIGFATILGSDMFNASLGAGTDSQGASGVYSLQVNAMGVTTLKTAAGQAITLVAVNATTVEGRYGAGLVAFRISIDAANGNLTLSQFTALTQPTFPNSFDETVAIDAGVLSARFTSTDGDGDSASVTADLGPRVKFEDDGPKITDPANDLAVANALNAMDMDTFVFDVGSDSPATFKIVGAPETGGFDWDYADVNGDMVIGMNEIIGTRDGVDFYSLIVDSSGNYTFKLLDTLLGTNVMLDVKDIKAGGPDTNFIDVGALQSDDFVRISGFFNGDPAAVNESNANVGVINGNLDANETLGFQLFIDPNPNMAGDEFVQDISSITIGTKTPKSTMYTYQAFDDGVLVFSGAVTVGKNGSIHVEGPNGELFDFVTITSVNGNAVKIGLSDIRITTLPDDLGLGFDVAVIDADKDQAMTSFNAFVDGNNDGMIDAGAPLFGPMSATLNAEPTTIGAALHWEGNLYIY
jgi:hypothetical protein